MSHQKTCLQEVVWNWPAVMHIGPHLTIIMIMIMNLVMVKMVVYGQVIMVIMVFNMIMMMKFVINMTKMLVVVVQVVWLRGTDAKAFLLFDPPKIEGENL